MSDDRSIEDIRTDVAHTEGAWWRRCAAEWQADCIRLLDLAEQRGDEVARLRSALFSAADRVASLGWLDGAALVRADIDPPAQSHESPPVAEAETEGGEP